MDFSVIAKLGQDPKYASQKDEYQVKLYAEVGERDPRRIGRDSSPNTIVIHFFSNSWDLHKKITLGRFWTARRSSSFTTCAWTPW